MQGLLGLKFRPLSASDTADACYFYCWVGYVACKGLRPEGYLPADDWLFTQRTKSPELYSKLVVFQARLAEIDPGLTVRGFCVMAGLSPRQLESILCMDRGAQQRVASVPREESPPPATSGGGSSPGPGAMLMRKFPKHGVCPVKKF